MRCSCSAVNVKFGDLDIDFVNLRCESYSANSRIPQMHHGTPAEDALRRDLTINALFYNIHTGLVEDFTGRGLSDLQAGVVRTPLPSLVTLLDDPLRAFRLVRFACRFGFAINAEAATACRNSTVHANLAHKVSRERSRDEMFKMLRTSSAVRAVTLLHSFGLLQCLLPMSEELYTNRSSTVMSQRHQGRKVFNLEPLRGSAVIKETFLAQGVCTAQFLGYLHALLETNPVNEQEGGGSRSAQQSRWPLVRKAFQTQREMEDPAIQLW